MTIPTTPAACRAERERVLALPPVQFVHESPTLTTSYADLLAAHADALARLAQAEALADRLERQLKGYEAEAGHHQPNSRTQVHFAAMAEASRDALRALRQALATAQGKGE